MQAGVEAGGGLFVEDRATVQGEKQVKKIEKGPGGKVYGRTAEMRNAGEESQEVKRKTPSPRPQAKRNDRPTGQQGLPQGR